MRDCNFHANIMEFVISFVFKNKNIIGMEQIMQPCKYVSELSGESGMSLPSVSKYMLRQNS